MLITLVEHRTASAAIVYAYEPNGQYFGNGGTVDDWQRWIAANRPEWPTPVVADAPPDVPVVPPDHGEMCKLCRRFKRDAWEYRLNAISLAAFGHIVSGEPPWCRLCNPDGPDAPVAMPVTSKGA